jgi:hypothetical protein
MIERTTDDPLDTRLAILDPDSGDLVTLSRDESLAIVAEYGLHIFQIEVSLADIADILDALDQQLPLLPLPAVERYRALIEKLAAPTSEVAYEISRRHLADHRKQKGL